MRPDTTDLQIDIRFDCAATPGTFRRSEAAVAPHMCIEHLHGYTPKTVTGHAFVPTGDNILLLNMQGSLMLRTSPQQRLTLVPPRSIVFARNTRLIVQAARGDHSAQLVTWQSGITPLLDHWIVTRFGSRTVAQGNTAQRNIACRAVDPEHRLALQRFEDALVGDPDLLETRIVSVLYEWVPGLMSRPDQIQLAAVPADLPETVRELTEQVRSNPANSWPLKDAADFAGYSPFHFSRVFKNLVGYGFHEFVDRCRTEAAVELLCSQDGAVDIIASSCGFGTTQGLRESIKEYLGLVPSELRAIPEVLDFGY